MKSLGRDKGSHAMVKKLTVFSSGKIYMMPIGIIVAIVTAIVIVLIASGVGYYYYAKTPADTSTDIDATGAQVSTGILSSVDGPVTTIDRTSGITGSVLAAGSGANMATPVAPPIPGPPTQSAVVTAPSAPVSVTMTAPIITQPGAPAATSLQQTQLAAQPTAQPTAQPSTQPAPPAPKTEVVDTTLREMRAQAESIAKILNIVTSSASLSEKQKAAAEVPKIIEISTALSNKAQDKVAAARILERIKFVQQRISAEMTRATAIPVQSPQTAPAPVASVSSLPGATPQNVSSTQNVFVAPKPVGTVAQPAQPVWDPKIPRLSILLGDIDRIHAIVVKSNVDFDTKKKAAQSLPSVEIFTLSVNQEIKNADPKTDAAKAITVTRDIYRKRISEIVAVITAGPPPPKIVAPAPAPVAVALPATMPTVSAPVSAGATQYNVLKAQIDLTLKTALDPKATDAQKITEAKKLPSLATFKQAADRAIADAMATPGVVTSNLVASIQKETADYTRRLTQGLTILNHIKVSPCGNTKESAALLGCKVVPYTPSPLGQCAKGYTGVPCAPGTGCSGKICVQGTLPGVLKYVNPGGLLAFFK